VLVAVVGDEMEALVREDLCEGRPGRGVLGDCSNDVVDPVDDVGGQPANLRIHICDSLGLRGPGALTPLFGSFCDPGGRHFLLSSLGIRLPQLVEDYATSKPPCSTPRSLR
jgi:hypothetical protein